MTMNATDFEAAACAAYLAYSGHTDPRYWEELAGPEQDAWRQAVAAAAPHLRATTEGLTATPEKPT